MRKSSTVVLCMVLLLTATRLPAQHAPDALLTGFHVGKAALAFLAAGTALTDPYAAPAERAVVGGGAVVVGVPAVMVLAAHWSARPAALGRWRLAAFVADLSVSLAAVGYGVWRIGTEQGIADQYAGFFAVIAGGAGALLSGVDLLPFAAER